PQIVDAVQMVGMRMGPKHGIDAADAGIEQLHAHIGRGIDQQDRAALLHQDRGAAPAVTRLVRIAAAPAAAHDRHAERCATSQDGHFHALRSLGILLKRRKKLSVVTRASAASSKPRTEAAARAVWTTKAGSLRLPRIGTGAR